MILCRAPHQLLPPSLIFFLPLFSLSCADINVHMVHKGDLPSPRNASLIRTPAHLLQRNPAISHETQRIVGGKAAHPGHYPWIVALLADYNGTGSGADEAQICTGTLIAPDFVVTAKHCIVDTRGRPYDWETSLIIGATNLSAWQNEIFVYEGIIYFPQYVGWTAYWALSDTDIAVLQLERATSLPFINVPKAIVATTATVAGWGKLKYLGQNPAQLQVLENVPLQDDSCCLASFRNYDPEYALCAGFMAAGKGTCNGDSGGPLMVLDSASAHGYSIIAVVSGGYQCAREGFFDVYADLVRVRALIYDIVPVLTDMPTPLPTPLPTALPTSMPILPFTSLPS